MHDLSDGAVAALLGLAGGVVLGLAARRARFCTLGAIEDAMYAQDYRRARMWALALAVAIVFVFSLDAVGAVALEQSIYARAGWTPLAWIIGGLSFGYGMALSGNCGFGALARAGGGDLKSVVIVLVMGIAAYAAIAGPLAPLRVALTAPRIDVEGLSISAPHALGALVGLPAWPLAFALAAGFGIWALRCARFCQERQMLGYAAAVGAVIAFGWWSTSALSLVAFDPVPVGSYTFTGPLGETVLFAMTSSAGGLSFGVGSVAGVLCGATLGSWSNGEFRWEACDDPRELGRQMAGAALMGVGGVIAMGCSIGQGLTAFSMLSVGAPLVALSILSGAALGLRQLIEGAAPHQTVLSFIQRLRDAL